MISRPGRVDELDFDYKKTRVEIVPCGFKVGAPECRYFAEISGIPKASVCSTSCYPRSFTSVATVPTATTIMVPSLIAIR